MGHYYSEMCCEKCGGIPCRCPDTRIGKFTIMDDYRIDKYYGSYRSDRHRYADGYYNTIEEAKAAIPAAIEKNIAALQKEVSKKLKAIFELQSKLKEFKCE